MRLVATLWIPMANLFKLMSRNNKACVIFLALVFIVLGGLGRCLRVDLELNLREERMGELLMATLEECQPAHLDPDRHPLANRPRATQTG